MGNLLSEKRKLELILSNFYKNYRHKQNKNLKRYQHVDLHHLWMVRSQVVSIICLHLYVQILYKETHFLLP